jgi:hypothetical protein
MAFSRPAGFISAFFDPLKNPNAPTIGTATNGDTTASVAFTAPSNVGGSAITAYYAVSNPDQVTATGASSPIVVTGLTNGTPYTFSVWALNSYGPGPFSAASNSVTPAVPQQAFFAGGDNSGTILQQIDIIVITTTGNSTNFGNLSATQYAGGACSSATRSIIGGGDSSDSRILFFTMSSGGATGTFGTLNQAVGGGPAGASNSTRGLILGGFYFSGSNVWANNIQFVTIATTGNATDFGDLTLGRSQTTACASPTRAVCAGGNEGSANRTTVMDYVTIASAGNAISFGSLLVANRKMAGASSSTRGVFAGGLTTEVVNVIQYITIASTGNAIDFGDLTVARQEMGGTSGLTRAVFGGGAGGTNVIDYITIASTGNAIDFGDLSVPRSQMYQTTSNCHGGLQ